MKWHLCTSHLTFSSAFLQEPTNYHRDNDFLHKEISDIGLKIIKSKLPFLYVLSKVVKMRANYSKNEVFGELFFVITFDNYDNKNKFI